jgi:hypothetical protein
MTTTNPPAADERIACRRPSGKVSEPEELFDWTARCGQVIGDELLTTSGPTSTSHRRRRFSREEIAAMLEMGIRFEAVLNAARA